MLQKISDAPLTDCPECGKAEFKKQLTAAGFQLKGTGWYVTDFRNGGSGGGSPKSESVSASASSSATSTTSTSTSTASSGSSASSSANDSKPATANN